MSADVSELLAHVEADEELADVLIAISVVSRMLARKLQTGTDKEGNNHE